MLLLQNMASDLSELFYKTKRVNPNEPTSYPYSKSDLLHSLSLGETESIKNNLQKVISELSIYEKQLHHARHLLDTIDNIVQQYQASKITFHRSLSKVYPYSFTEAIKRKETDIYNIAYRENLLCANVIQNTIHSHFDGQQVSKNYICQILQQFGYTRVCWVMAHNIEQRKRDPHISQKNKDWAASISIPDDAKLDYGITTQSELIDIFLDALRDLHCQTHKLASSIIQFCREHEGYIGSSVLEKALRYENCTDVTEMLLNRRTDYLCNYLQAHIDLNASTEAAYSVHKNEYAKAAVKAAAIMNHINDLNPDFRGIVLKIKEYGSFHYTLARIPTMDTVLIEHILQQMNTPASTQQTADEILNHFKNHQLMPEYIGDSNSGYWGGFPADIILDTPKKSAA